MIVEPAERPEHGVCAVLPGAGLPGAPPHDDSPDAGQKGGSEAAVSRAPSRFGRE